MEHLAIIMDGNGRWAAARGKLPLFGHRAGADTLDRVMHYCREVGIRYLTVYAFSTENWQRPKAEVDGLMALLSHFIAAKRRQLLKEGVRFKVIGRRTDLSDKLQAEIAELEQVTAAGEFTLTVALSYGGRDEIMRAAVKFAERTPGASDAERERQFLDCLDTAGLPDPDLIVRTSGELRLSNFLLFQAAYSEFYFSPVYWPDFDRAEFDRACASYALRERRRGAR